MAENGGFLILTRGDGSKVAIQPLRVLFLSKGDHGTIINFGAGTQVNVKEPFEDVLLMVGGASDPG